MKKPTDDPVIRKPADLRKSQWDEIADFRFANRITTRTEALRQVVGEGLKGLKRNGKKS